MRYAVLMYHDETHFPSLTEAEQVSYLHAHDAFEAAVEERGTLLWSSALHTTDTATTLRLVAGRPVLTDGPFAETTEQLGGFYLVEAPSLEEVTAMCTLLPAAYSVEIRPIRDMAPEYERMRQLDAGGSR